MIVQKKILAIIPARGGSKGLPRKNIRSILGKPLIAWTIESAMNSYEISKVIVSTDDLDIAKVAKEYGAEIPFIRPSYLATDASSSVDVILHALDFFEERGETYDIVILLEPTSPLRKKNDISDAISAFLDNYDDIDGIISLGEIQLENPYIAKVIDENGMLMPLMENDSSITQRQQYPKTYFPYGVLYAVKTDVFRAEKSVYTRLSKAYIIERWQNYEIDDEYDFICVEAILKRNKNKM